MVNETLPLDDWQESGMTTRRNVLLAGAGLLAVSGCALGDRRPRAADVLAHTAKLDAFFEEVFEERIVRSPQLATSLGDRRGYDRWDDVSDAHADADLAIAAARVGEMKTRFDPALLTQGGALSFRLFEAEHARAVEAHKWRRWRYRFDQMNGVHQGAVTFLLNQHKVESLADAESYVSRLEGLGPYLRQQIVLNEASAEVGILMPAFVYDYSIPGARNIITGAPFGVTAISDTQLAALVKPDAAPTGSQSPLWGDALKKVRALDAPDDAKIALLQKAQTALRDSVRPAYEAVIAMLEDHKGRTGTDDGVWRLPEGGAYYTSLLERQTTTKLTGDEIHAIGLAQVARLHGEMRAIMTRVNFTGDLKAFFEFMETDQRFYEADTPEGKRAYVEKAAAAIEAMRLKLPDWFGRLPKAQLEVRAVEDWREQSAGLAFYNRPAPDGSRPGIYYANTFNMKALPLYQLEALAYHEGIPGHHMQIAIAQELEGIPRFRRFGGYTAYSEGWGLYCERLAREMGAYEDPYSDFGRLVLELRRAIRLVVDTGLHHKKWPRQQAIDYVLANQPGDEPQARKDIDRYIVMPGQATAYMIGQMEILRLREEAKLARGEHFDIKGFHDTVLGDGALPLDILGERVKAWSELPLTPVKPQRRFGWPFGR
ncbi:MAG: putative lipoprotein [Alphaproteobacteria bacterium]|nr:MAG: putative lipoprotein [Caulobacteraceae bacterium]TPW05849.1 MAG: putative lipoprotein [Alphaproteobacteria bacterium]